VIVGGVTPEEVERNVAAVNHRIPASLWSDLKNEGLLPESVPTPAS
jgi:D-threo-aldose 1-dehydrogenase